jgi:hypothetical protein
MKPLAVKDWPTMGCASSRKINRRAHEDTVQAAKTRFRWRLLCSGVSMGPGIVLYLAVTEHRYNGSEFVFLRRSQTTATTDWFVLKRLYGRRFVFPSAVADRRYRWGRFDIHRGAGSTVPFWRTSRLPLPWAFPISMNQGICAFLLAFPGCAEKGVGR